MPFPLSDIVMFMYLFCDFTSIFIKLLIISGVLKDLDELVIIFKITCDNLDGEIDA